MTIGAQFATLAYVETMRRNLMRAISGAGIAQHAPDVDGGAAENFIELADCPQTYSGAAGKVVAVNAAADGLYFNPYLIVSETTPLVCINETANANMTAGLTINQGSADDEIFALKSSDVWNGLDVAWIETDTYAQFQKIAGASGGLDIKGLGESATGLQLEGFAWTGFVDTTRATTSTGIINLISHEVNYNGSVEMALSAGVNLLAIRHGLTPTTVWVIDVDGDTWQAGSADIGGAYQVDGVQVVSNRVIDADFANTPDSGDADTDALIDKIRDALITHGLIASSSGPS